MQKMLHLKYCIISFKIVYFQFVSNKNNKYLNIKSFDTYVEH